MTEDAKGKAVRTTISSDANDLKKIQAHCKRISRDGSVLSLSAYLIDSALKDMGVCSKNPKYLSTLVMRMENILAEIELATANKPTLEQAAELYPFYKQRQRMNEVYARLEKLYSELEEHVSFEGENGR